MIHEALLTEYLKYRSGSIIAIERACSSGRATLLQKNSKHFSIQYTDADNLIIK